jgi:hypothetical protein
VADCRPEFGTPIDAVKLRSLQVMGDKSRPRPIEGREHPESGRPFKTVVTEVGSTTEHNTKDDRVDAVAFVDTIRAHIPRSTGG